MTKKNGVFIFISLFLLSSCVLIQESRNKKRLENVEYETVYDVDAENKVDANNDAKEDSKKTETQDAARKNVTDSDSNKIWYHPNPWWRIESEPFRTSTSPIKYTRDAPQYGFQAYIDPLADTAVKGMWGNWKKMNHLDYEKGSIIHIWQGFISTNKDIFSKHPEYLAEIDGKRLGYGKSNKLCVSNKDVQNLFIQYTEDRIQKNPQLKLFSVEPSDGANFCTCSNCKKLGSISNQVFYFANQVAKGIQKKYPDKELGLLAYYTHSAPPSFPIEKNIKVIIASQGFQSAYTPMNLLKAWKKVHNNLGLYEYFGIPQWKGDQPRVVIQEYIERLQFATNNHFDMVILESGSNINATILKSLYSKMMMNPELSWEDVFNKFLEDCFEESRIPIDRLLKRWHKSAYFKDKDIQYSLNDLNEASKLAKNLDEIQRIRDLKAYLHYLVLYNEWNKNRKDPSSKKEYFDYLYNSSNRNIVNYNALTQLFAKFYNTDAVLKSRYGIRYPKDKAWIRYISDQEIENNFNKDLKLYPPLLSPSSN